MKKYFMTALLCVSLIFCFLINAFAIDYPNVVANLKKDMTVARSTTTAGTHKFYGGTNYVSSKHAVYFEAQRSSGNSFVEDSYKLVSAGNSIDNVLTGFTSSTVLWRLELNPYGIVTKNCTATGYMWYKM